MCQCEHILIMSSGFQVLTAEELEAARLRVFPDEPGPDPCRPYRNQIDLHGYQKVLVIGASHTTHWATYTKSSEKYPGDQEKLENFRFVGVGGAKLQNITEWIQGENLPVKNAN